MGRREGETSGRPVSYSVVEAWRRRQARSIYSPDSVLTRTLSPIFTKGGT